MNKQEHGEKCTEKRCHDTCGFRRFEAWLDAPLFDDDMRRHRRRADRFDLIRRGEIPA